MKTQILFTALAISLLSGCKSTSNNHIPKGANSEKPYDLRVDTYEKKECCADLKGITPLTTSKTITATMEENDKLIKVGGLESPFLFIEIANKPQTYFYSIKSYYLRHEFAFIPQVSVLDKNYNVIAQTDPDYISYQHQTLVYDDSHFWMYFSIDTKTKPEAKYLLVHTASDFGSTFQVNLASQTNLQTTMIGNQPVSYAETSNAFAVKTKVSPSGVLQIDELDFWSKPINDYLIQPL